LQKRLLIPTQIHTACGWSLIESVDDLSSTIFNEKCENC